MNLQTRELYASPNGDRWFLARDPDSGRVFVQHGPNAPSGGRTTQIEIGTFLVRDAHGPEHQALLRLIATLIDRCPDVERAKDQTRPGPTPGSPHPNPADPFSNPPSHPSHMTEAAPPAQPNELPPDPDGSLTSETVVDHPFGTHDRQ